ncbi:MAG: type II toxin-antitoxin system RelE/ParE family toxin [Alphaproteobacteria bacterium]
MRPVVFLGGSLGDLRAFPNGARHTAGLQLDRIQRGLEPDDWKPLKTIGQGVREIRVKDSSGIFRVIYVTVFADVVYVLHAFQKKSQKTSQRDLDLAAGRLKELKQRIGR